MRSARNFSLVATLVVSLLASSAWAKDTAKPKAAPAKTIDFEEPNPPVAWTIEDNSRHQRPQSFSLSLSLWPDVIAASAWYAYPIAPDGFIRDINDSFELEFGLTFGVYHNDSYFADGPNPAFYSIVPSFGGRWNFHLTRDWTTFATLKLGIIFGFGDYAAYNNDYVDVGFSFGALYRLQESLQLRLELGYPLGLSVGLLFPFGS